MMMMMCEVQTLKQMMDEKFTSDVSEEEEEEEEGGVEEEEGSRQTIMDKVYLQQH
jgi:hypothetical protein